MLQGCDETMLTHVNEAALAGIPGVELPIKRNANGAYIVSVESELGHLKVLNLVSTALASFLPCVSLF
jgi:hypothetical protein